jgi:hypothetical protein
MSAPPPWSSARQQKGTSKASYVTGAEPREYEHDALLRRKGPARRIDVSGAIIVAGLSRLSALTLRRDPNCSDD